MDPAPVSQSVEVHHSVEVVLVVCRTPPPPPSPHQAFSGCRWCRVCVCVNVIGDQEHLLTVFWTLCNKNRNPSFPSGFIRCSREK